MRRGSVMRYIAFLRGINVGGHRVKMERLRVLFEDMGLNDVSTFIASGNVMFSADSGSPGALTDRIERQLHEGLGYEVATFLRSPDQLEEIVAFGEPETGRDRTAEMCTYVALLRDPAPPEVRSSLAALETEMDEFHVSGTEIYWSIQGKLSESPLFGKGFEGALHGLQTTMRNMTTLKRLAAKLAAPYR